MHRIIATHLKSFTDSHGISHLAEDSQFERFVNFCVLAPRIHTGLDIEEVTTGDGEDGTDGIGVIINEELELSSDNAADTFSSTRKQNDVEVCFIQAKTSESVDLGDFLKFKESVLRFISAEQYDSGDELQRNCHDVFNTVLNNVPKLRNGKPAIVIRYATTSMHPPQRPLVTAIAEFRSQIKDLGLFSSIDIEVLSRDAIIDLWVQTYANIQAKLDLFSSAALPSISGIDQAYLVVVKAGDFVNNLLVSSDGSLRTQVFEENVRAFLGMENPVNTAMSRTIASGEGATRFPVLNNGITLACQKVIAKNQTLHLENFQIINGCQTSNVLFENRSLLPPDMMISLKVVETSNEDVFSELVRATNSQTKVDEIQFISLKPIVKKLEQFFNTFEGEDGRLYYERRDRQYVGQAIPATRIIPLHTSARCVAAMFLNRPDLASRYTKAMYEELSNQMFADDIRESVFYASALTLYRLQNLVSKATIPQNMRRFKWHMLPIIRTLICAKATPLLNSRQANKDAEKVVEVMKVHSVKMVEVFERAVAIVQSFGVITDDRLKRQAILNEMLDRI